MRTSEEVGSQKASWLSPYSLLIRMALDQVLFRLQASYRLRNGLKQIPGEHTRLAAASGDKISGEAMQIGSRTGGCPGRKPLSKEPHDHPRQDITGPSRGHSRVAGGIHGQGTVRAGQHRAGA